MNSIGVIVLISGLVIGIIILIIARINHNSNKVYESKVGEVTGSVDYSNLISQGRFGDSYKLMESYAGKMPTKKYKKLYILSLVIIIVSIIVSFIFFSID